MSKYITIVLIFLFSVSAFCEPVRSTANKKELVDVVIADDLFPWLMPILTPVVSIHSNRPILMATDEKDKAEHIATVVKAKKCFYAGNAITDFDYAGIDVGTFHVTTPFETSANIARRFWKKSNHIVLASMSSPQVVMNSSVFAALYKIPILLIEEEINNEKESVALHKDFLGRLIRDLGVEKIIILGDTPQWIKDSCSYDMYHLRKIQKAIIDKLQTQNIHNVIISRSPQNSYFPRSEWVIPYLSFVRNAPIFFSHTPQVEKLENIFRSYARQYNLTPRNVTLVGDEHNIQTKLITIPTSEELFEFQAEPFTDPEGDDALDYGVGRIPFSTLEDSSLMIARGFAHEKVFENKVPRVLLTSNPTAELVLAETISRITTEEFKNFDIDIDSYYSENYDDDKIWESLTNAQLVIYEGHVVDQRVYVDPDSELEEDLFFFDDGNNSNENSATNENSLSEGNSEDERFYSFSNPFKGPGVEQKSYGLPVVMLQSCHSLEVETTKYIFNCGSPAILGTTTNVHSGSGSSMLKIVCDEILYNNATLGEALHHGRNYFFCLNKLKSLRGHVQMSKSRRVALSFRLWGDPELKVFPKNLTSKKNKIIDAEFSVKNQRININTPKNKIPECITDRYYSDMFYYAKTAGIVKKIKGKVQRKLASFYFFKIKLPDGWVAENNFDLLYRINKEESGIRTVFKVSKDKRHLYVLYFPEKIEKKAKIELQFAKSE